jgi:hypothetical protein
MNNFPRKNNFKEENSLWGNMLCEGVASGIVFGLPSFKEIFGKKN